MPSILVRLHRLYGMVVRVPEGGVAGFDPLPTLHSLTAFSYEFRQRAESYYAVGRNTIVAMAA